MRKSVIDHLGILIATRDEIDKEIDKVKARLRDKFKATEQDEFVGKEYKATVYAQSRNTVDYKALLAHLNVSPELIAQFTKSGETVGVRVTDI